MKERIMTTTNLQNYFTKIAKMPRALHGDKWHPLILLSPEIVSQFVIPAKSRKA
jgi:hypothetical protein